jgi:penicillin amidase
MAWLAAPVAAALLYVGARPVGPAPALGPFIDPVHGIWAMGRTTPRAASTRATIPGLGDSVRVVYDDRDVPHIFAPTELDAYRALGYVVARDRLFQLELQTRAAAGTLTELLGAQALPLDREARDLGMPRAAERKLAAMDSADPGLAAARAYAEGVNAWIDELPADAMPVEFRLLGARPSRWEPINTIHLLNRMGLTLAHSRHELANLEARARVGAAAADALFPIVSPIQEPIQPAPGARPRLAMRPLPPPGRPDSNAWLVAERIGALLPAYRGLPRQSGDAVGSNNWAVAPSRTARGYALLAGDPHLELTLPSVWYEVHLVVPGVLDSYGVTIPGAPAIVIGFNRNVAWTFTNTDADVLDWYAEIVDHRVSPTRYRLDGSWVPLETRVERYRDRRGNLVATDTLRFTHRGPLRRSIGQWMSFRWTVLEASNETLAFVEGMRAGSAREWLDLVATYPAPAQNMLVADRSGTIAIRSTGWFPMRPGDGRGDVVRDGSSRASDWIGRWPLDRYPQSVNPPQGYLASANQQPIDPRVDPTYLGANWYPPWRAMRINTLLRADSAATPDAFRRYQTDPGSARADYFVPYFLGAARAVGDGDSAGLAAAVLAGWDRRYTPDNERAVLFEYAMQALSTALWDELDGPRPSDAMVATLVVDSSSAWWDLRATPVVERRDEILRRSLHAALDRARRDHGEPEGGGWRWSKLRRASIGHLLGIGSFSPAPVPVQGGPSTISPSSGNGRWGASWRMVVELGPEVRGWGVYPGGQSGNPISDRSRDRITRWAAGMLDSLRFPRAPADLATATAGSLLLTPDR